MTKDERDRIIRKALSLPPEALKALIDIRRRDLNGILASKRDRVSQYELYLEAEIDALESLQPNQLSFDSQINDVDEFSDNRHIVLPQEILSPSRAEFLLYVFHDPKTCDAFVGDLEERYHRMRKKFGKGKADFWYWKQTVWSLGPLAWAAAKRWVMKPVGAGLTLALAKNWIDHNSWLATLMDWWRRIGS